MTDRSDQEDELGRMYKARTPVPPTPAAEMWLEVEAQLPRPVPEARPATVVSLPERRSWAVWQWAAAAGVVLAIGVGIGRTSVVTSVVTPEGTEGASSPVAGVDPVTPGAEPGFQAFNALTRNRIADLEPLLTMIAADADGGRYDPQLGDWAKGQLNRTRLALDSPGASDPNVRKVLEDLELILMQVATLGDVDEARASQEMGLIAQALEDQGLLDRVRAMRARGP